jgi:hypothetical protein
VKVLISKIIYDNNIFNKTIDFMKVWWGEIFMEFMIFNETIDFMKIWWGEIFMEFIKVMIYKIFMKSYESYKSYEKL